MRSLELVRFGMALHGRAVSNQRTHHPSPKIPPARRHRAPAEVLASERESPHPPPSCRSRASCPSASRPPCAFMCVQFESLMPSFVPGWSARLPSPSLGFPRRVVEPRLPSPSGAHSPARSCASRSRQCQLDAHVRARKSIRARALRAYDPVACVDIILIPSRRRPPPAPPERQACQQKVPCHTPSGGVGSPPLSPCNRICSARVHGSFARVSFSFARNSRVRSASFWHREMNGLDALNTPVALYEHAPHHVRPQSVCSRCCRLPRAPWRAEPLCGRPSRSSQAPGTEAPDRSPSTSRNLRLECLVAPRPYMSRPRSSCLSPSRAQRVNFHSAPAQVSHLHLLHAPQIPACVFLLLIASPDSLRTEGAPGLHGPRAHRPRRLGLGSGAPWCSFRCSFGFYQ